MKIEPFALEEFWKEYEFTTPHLLCASDSQAWKVQEIVAMADEESRGLWENLDLGYTEVAGMPLLRSEIAKLYETLSADNIVTVAGGEEGIFCSLHTLLNPDSHVVVVAPCYQSLKSIPKSLGCEVTTLSLRPENGWQLTIADLDKAFGKRVDLLIVNYPQNPTGMLMEESVFTHMIALAREHGAWIFSDEMYRLMELETPLPAVADVYEKGVSLFGASKSFGLPGLRIAWIASPNRDFLDKLEQFKVYTSICNSAPSEVLALIALRNKEKILVRIRGIVEKTSVLLTRW